MDWIFDNFGLLLIIGVAAASWMKNRGEAAEEEEAERQAREEMIRHLQEVGDRKADLLITISNDTWFGDSLGPLQHLQMARMRAMENGRYMIRGTNNGISAIINEHGEIVAQSSQFVRETLTGEAQVMLGETPYTDIGSAPIIGLCFIALLLLFGAGTMGLRLQHE